MLCDVCNSTVVEGEGHRLPPEAFRELLDAGFGIDMTNVELLVSAGIPREVAIKGLREEYLKSNSDWLLCAKCLLTARNALRQDTKLQKGIANCSVHKFPKQLSHCDGLIPLESVLELDIGEEVALYWIDRTPFIESLGALRPFQLELKSGLFRSYTGPLLWLLFYVPNRSKNVFHNLLQFLPNRKPNHPPYASVDCHINPLNSQHMQMWRRLDNQTHWHLTLIGAENKVVDCFEFENSFELGFTLDRAVEACSGLECTDFSQVKRDFIDAYSLEELYEMT